MSDKNKTFRVTLYSLTAVLTIILLIVVISLALEKRKTEQLLQRTCDKIYPQEIYDNEYEYGEAVSPDGEKFVGKVLSNKSIANVSLRVEGLGEYCKERR